MKRCSGSKFASELRDRATEFSNFALEPCDFALELFERLYEETGEILSLIHI